MALLMPAALREVFGLSIALYEDGSACVAVEVGPDRTVTEFRTAALSPAPDGLRSASEVACWLIGIWADAGVLGLASEAPG
jgi:hypothetical protein